MNSTLSRESTETKQPAPSKPKRVVVTKQPRQQATTTTLEAPKTAPSTAPTQVVEPPVWLQIETMRRLVPEVFCKPRPPDAHEPTDKFVSGENARAPTVFLPKPQKHKSV